MEALKVDKAKLLAILKGNRDKHRASFLAAQSVYRELVIAELDGMLKDAKDGTSIRRRVNLKAPEDRTSDYDRRIGLMEMSTDTSIDMDVNEYMNFVEDNWSWSSTAGKLHLDYTSRNISPMFVGEDTRMPSSY